MKKIVILGGGTAGTMMANKLAPALEKCECQITIVDQDETHYYQPGFLFIPFDIYTIHDVVKPKRDFYPPNVDVILSSIEEIQPKSNKVKLSNGKLISYDILIVATGSKAVPEELEGLKNGGWRQNIFDFYTPDGAGSIPSPG